MCSSDVEQYDTKFIYISPVHPVILIRGTHHKRQQAATINIITAKPVHIPQCNIHLGSDSFFFFFTFNHIMTFFHRFGSVIFFLFVVIIILVPSLLFFPHSTITTFLFAGLYSQFPCVSSLSFAFHQFIWLPILF